MRKNCILNNDNAYIDTLNCDIYNSILNNDNAYIDTLSCDIYNNYWREYRDDMDDLEIILERSFLSERRFHFSLCSLTQWYRP